MKPARELSGTSHAQAYEAAEGLSMEEPRAQHTEPLRGTGDLHAQHHPRASSALHPHHGTSEKTRLLF